MPLIAALVFLLFAADPTRAQTVTATTGAVNGTVSDSSKAAMPGVTVRVSGPAMMTAQMTITDRAGEYRFSAVPPGDYRLAFEVAGFGTIGREGIRVGLGFTGASTVPATPPSCWAFIRTTR